MKLICFFRDPKTTDARIVCEIDLARDTMSALGKHLANAAITLTVHAIALDLKPDTIEMRTYSGVPSFNDHKNPDFSLKIEG